MITQSVIETKGIGGELHSRSKEYINGKGRKNSDSAGLYTYHVVGGITSGVFRAPQSTDAVATALRACLEWPVGTGCQNGGSREGKGAEDADDLHGFWLLVMERFVCVLSFLDVGSVCVDLSL